MADVLIIGAGAAGAACAATLREEGFEGSIVLAGREPDAPYERPPASKSYLQGESSREEALLHGEDFWAEHDIDLRTRTSVAQLDTEARTARLASQETLEYGEAVLATGANVRRLRVDGGGLEGIHYLRALGNADTIRADAEEPGHGRVVLVGGSYIACEVAASLTTMGMHCTLVAMEDAPMSNGFGSAVGGWIGDLLKSKGIELAMGERLARFEGEGDRVAKVVCESGNEFACDLVVMGTGAVPDVTLARAAGLELGDSGGVKCDARLRTSADGVWAAGDICEYDSGIHGRHLRVEHFEVAQAQGAFVARAINGSDAVYTEIPYFWTDLADWASLEYVGPAESWAREAVRGSVDDGEFSVFYLDGEDRVLGAVTAGRSADLDEARELMRSGAPFSDK